MEATDGAGCCGPPALPDEADAAPTVTVVNSSEVQVGPRLFYNAPVVINQFVSATATLAEVATKATSQGLDHVHVGTSSWCKALQGAPEELRPWRLLRLSLVATASILGVCLLLAVALTLSSASPRHPDTDTTLPPALSEPPLFPAPPERPDPAWSLPGGHRVISKRQWGGRPARARPPDQPPFALAHPTMYVLISHTAGNPCFDPTACSRICRDIQDAHTGGEIDTPDIAFNFLVGGDGNAYEGRGWDVTNARQGLAGRLRRANLDVCFLGNFVHDEPTPAQLAAAQHLLELGVRLGKLHPRYRLLSHNDTSPTPSPGRNIFLHIKQWPHFTVPSELDA